MGTLAGYLQDSFIKSCPPDWTCAREVPVLDPRLERLFGYAPKADVVLQRTDGTRKLWIEFEVSRADPVANHAKFATAHLFQPQQASETFVSMVSSILESIRADRRWAEVAGPPPCELYRLRPGNQALRAVEVLCLPADSSLNPEPRE
jgi:hypothetical protein